MPTSIYVHIPFCRHRCAYCDFNTFAGLEDLMPAYVRALEAEIRAVGRSAERLDRGRRVHTLFFGGGTPSLLSAEQLGAILTQLHRNFELTSSVEISLEANPGTADLEGLRAMRRLGVNRLSLGMQSSHDDELAMLERQHGMNDVRRSVSGARQAGFENINLDLIYGLPGQDLARWQTSLKAAIDLAPDHLSLYALSLEFGTPMRKWVQDGQLPAPDPDLAADMYDLASDVLQGAGFLQYEISNWARPGSDGEPMACQHNLQIWRNRDYLGFGAGAHGCAAGWRTRAARSPRGYIDRLSGPETEEVFPFSRATEWREPQSTQQAAEDTMILGLRLTREGVSRRAYAQRFGRSMEADHGDKIRALAALGLLEDTAERVRLSPKARLLGNQVFQRFLA
jgi:oxygen-independent coproporphyrinogen-3 oxidase